MTTPASATTLGHLLRAYDFWLLQKPEDRDGQMMPSAAYDYMRLERPMGYDDETDELIMPDEAELARRRASGEFLEGLPVSSVIRKFHGSWRGAHAEAGLPSGRR